MRLICVLLTAALALSGSPASAEPPMNGGTKTFVVSPSGNDQADGTLTHPLKTWAAAVKRVREWKAGSRNDVRVLFRGGRYELDRTVVLGPEDSGSAGQVITYAAYPGEKPVFSSGQAITDWTLVGEMAAGGATPPGLPVTAADHVWVASVPDGFAFKALFEDGKLLDRARGASFSPTREGTTTQMHLPRAYARSWAHPDDVEVVSAPAGWQMNISPLAGVTFEVNDVNHANEATITTSIPARYPWGRFRKDPRSHFENSIELLDAPGEWVLDTHADKVYFWPTSGTPGDVRAPQLTELMRVEGDIDADGPVDVAVSHLRFEGLTFTEGDRDTYPVGYRGHDLQHGWDLHDRANALVRFRGVTDSTIRDSVFQHSGGNGFRCDLTCARNTVTGNHVHDLGGAGILFAGYGPGTKDTNRDNAITNNHVHHIGRITEHSMGVWVWQSGHNRIAHNRIHHTPYTGLGVTGRIGFTRGTGAADGEGKLTVRWPEIEERTEVPAAGWDVSQYDAYEPFLHGRENVVEYNDLSDVMQTFHDGNAIYVSGTARGNIIRRNFIHDCPSEHLVSAIRNDDAQYDTLVAQNLITQLGRGAGFVSKQRNDLVNNIVANRSEPGPMLSLGIGPVTGSEHSGNVYYATAPSQPMLVEGPSYRGPIPRFWELHSDANTYYSTVDNAWGRSFRDPFRRTGRELNSLVTDPGFYDPAQQDYRMTPGSLVAAMGFPQVDPREYGLTDSYRSAPEIEGEALSRVFVASRDQFAWIRLGSQASAPLTVHGRTTTGFVADLSDASVSWSSSAPSVATVAGGQVLAHAEGRSILTASVVLGGVRRTTRIYVIVGIDSLGLKALLRHGEQLRSHARTDGTPGSYPASAVTALASALDDARAVLKRSDVTQSEVDATVVDARDRLARFTKAVLLAHTDTNGSAAAFRYSGSWSNSTRRTSGDLGSDLRVTGTNGDRVTLSLDLTAARRVALLGPTGPGNGEVRVLIDGQAVPVVRPVTADYRPQQEVWAADLSAGRHDIVFEKAGGEYLQIDGFRTYLPYPTFGK